MGMFAVLCSLTLVTAVKDKTVEQRACASCTKPTWRTTWTTITIVNMMRSKWVEVRTFCENCSRKSKSTLSSQREILQYWNIPSSELPSCTITIRERYDQEFPYIN